MKEIICAKCKQNSHGDITDWIQSTLTGRWLCDICKLVISSVDGERE